MSEKNCNGNMAERYNPGLKSGKFLSHPPPGEEVVISGMAGTFPASRDINHFMENLFNKVEMINGLRWDLEHPDIPPSCGIVPEIDKLDLGSFGWHQNTETMEPSMRVLGERVIEAIYDAGLNPTDFENTNTGVFNSACYTDNDSCIVYGITKLDTVLNTGKSPAVNRFSHFLKTKGPCALLDTACSSSLYALDHAFRAIRTGEIEAAIITGTNLIRHPSVTLQFFRLGVLSPDSRCKVFDERGDGYVRSEGVAALILQKKKDAKRCYAEVVHTKTNCDGYKEDGITFPSGKMQTVLLREFYEECGINPHDLSYMEAHGTGTRVGDPEESKSLEDVFATGKKDTLLIGSVKSNIGHSEPSSGICSIIKCIIATETGFIPPNQNFIRPRPELKAIVDGRMKVVTEKTPFNDNRGLLGVNSFGFGGANSHVLLRKNFKEKNSTGEIPQDDLPRLMCVSGRTNEAVDYLLDAVTFDVNHIGLLHNIFRKNVPSHVYRGYAIFDKSGEVQRYSKSYFRFPKPMYLIFGEINTLFDIGNQLLPIQIFSEAFHKIQQHLLSSGINIMEMIVQKSAEIHNHPILYSTVVQVAIAETLKKLKVNAKEVFGYSYGILPAMYFNNIMTIEETLDCALLFDKLQSHNLINDAPHITNGTTNGTTDKLNGTTNGTTDKLNGYSNGVSNGNHVIPLKPTTTENIRKKLILGLSPIIHNNGPSPEYLCDYILNKQDLSCNIFDLDSLVLKIGIVSLAHIHEDLNIQTAFSTKSQNYVFNLLDLLGKSYCEGQNPQVHELYPKIEFPVPRGTKMISPFIKWNHSKKLFTLTFNKADIFEVGKSKTRTVTITNEREWSYVTGHVIDGRNLFPATGYLYLVWNLLADFNNEEVDHMNVLFEDCRFIRATTVPSEGPLKLQVSILRSGYFEIAEADSPIVSGKISASKELKSEINTVITNPLVIQSKDIYKELRLRGYNYCKGFKAMHECDIDATQALIKWEDNWVTFMDNMLQMKILQTDSRALYVPTYIAKLSIDPKKHKEWIANNYQQQNEILLPAFASSKQNDISSGYITINGLLATPISKKKDLGIPVLEKYQFVPNSTNLDLTESVRVNCQIILENTLQYDIKCIELIDEWTNNNCISLSPMIKEVFEDQPLVKPEITIFSGMELNVTIPVEKDNLSNASDCTLIIASNLLKRKEILDQAIRSLQDNGYIISRESIDSSVADLNDPRVTVVTNYHNSLERIFMIKKNKKSPEPLVIKISEEANFDWIDTVKDVLESKKQNNVILYAEEEPTSGIIGLVNCLRREPESSHLRCFFIIDKIDGFKPKAPFFKQQLDKNLAMNVFKDGSWGTYRHLLLNQSITTESEHFEINSLVLGDMSSLRWVEASLSTSPFAISEKIPVQVHYSAINFKDVMVASGKLHSSVICSDRLMEDDLLGFEYSGIDMNGRKIAGINVPALSTMIMADKYFTFEIPDSMTLEEAATIPAVYGTVLYAFVTRARMKRGCSILIHSATGGVGQAAITIAQHYRCEIFVTIGTPEKKEFLKKNFPKIKDSNIGNSRDTSFEQMIHRQTRGRGVDIVLNSLSEDKLLASVRCLAKGGKFLEIGKFDLSINNDLSMLLMNKTASYHGIMFDKYFNETAEKKTEIMKLVEDGIRNSIIKPLNRTVFDYNDVEQAFRYMTTGKHMGKVLVKVKPNETDSIKKNTCFTRYRCDANKTYVILGGLGGFGLELADWLILRGARKLVLTSRKGVTNGYQKLRLKTWSSYGVLVQISQVDIFTRGGCETLLRQSEQLGPVHAIFNLAVVLADAIFENQTIESFKTSFAPKAVATKHLDEASRILCPSLRDFVIFSSVSCGRGNSGQTNYGMANSVMERICEVRRKEGFPAVAIEWGAIGDVGLVAEMQEDHKILEIGGTLQQKITNCLNVLDVLLTQRESAIVSSMVVAEKRSGNSGALNAVEAVLSLIGIHDQTTISHHTTLPELGMDSMMAVEIKQILERDFGTFLTAKEIKTLSLVRLQEIDENFGKSEETSDGAKRNPYGYSIFGKLSEEFSTEIVITKLQSAVDDTSNADTVILFPGIEGNPVVLKELAREIKAHVYCLEYTTDIAGTSLADLIKLVKPLVKEKLDTKPFKFIAHSFGGCVALEVANILESEGYSGKIFLLDSSPAVLNKLTAALQTKFATNLETSVLCEWLQLYYKDKELIPLKETLENCGASKLQVFTKIFRQKSSFSLGFIEHLYRGMTQRAKFCQDYQPSFNKIGSPITLARATEMEIIDDRHDYGLADISRVPVKVHVIESNHSSILEHEQTTQVLNEWI